MPDKHKAAQNHLFLSKLPRQKERTLRARDYHLICKNWDLYSAALAILMYLSILLYLQPYYLQSLRTDIAAGMPW